MLFEALAGNYRIKTLVFRREFVFNQKIKPFIWLKLFAVQGFQKTHG
jgi:hypothetical protein